MKKKWLGDSIDPGLLQKMSRIMRLVFILIFGFTMAVSAESYSQGMRMDVNLKNSSIREVMDYVENNSKFIFLYKNEDLNVDKKVNLDLKGAKIDEILDELFTGENVEYDIYDRQIVVRAADKMSLHIQQYEKNITGIVSDGEGQPIPGATVVVTGTAIGTVTGIDGNFKLSIPESAQYFQVSFVGMKTQEIAIEDKTQFMVILESAFEDIDEVVVVGYGVQKKVNLTASVSQVDSKVIENRPVANTAQALQGAVANLQISNTSYGGEPGAAMDINIRGFMTSGGTGSIGSSSPLILVDGIEMDMNNIDPEDIETVSVLKDAAAASIYGARAAGGAIIITTKNGKSMKGGMKISYSNNFSWSQPTIWPEQASAIDFAYTMNDASYNIGGTGYYNDEQLEWIKMNMAVPGSAPTMVPKANGLDWDQSNGGLGATGSTNWKDFLFNDWSSRQKHNINFAGGDESLNYYVSAGLYDENGLLSVADEAYNRYNLDAKINAKPFNWLSFSLLTKFIKSNDTYPWDSSYGTGRIFDVLSKIKPTLPTVDPIFNEPNINAWYPTWRSSWEENENNQIVLLPRVVLEPVKDWLINLEYNYKRNNNRQIFTSLQYEYHRPNGDVAYTPSQEQTQVQPYLRNNEYYSPNLFTTYSKLFKGHNFKILAGYQSELYEAYNLSAKALGLLSDNVPSISTSVGEQTVDDVISHWTTQSFFSRFNYDYQGKYLLEVSYRRDGSSRFEEDSRWAGFPSFSAGYNVAREEFWPIKDWISTFKLRGSYGTLGNQNVSNYLYVPGMSITKGNFLFDGAWDYVANAPDLTSINLTWETVQTTDFGLDVSALKDRLTVNFDWYRTDIMDMAAQGEALPAVLGTDAPLTNIGTSRVQGWESEIMWKQKIRDFNYNVRFVLSDYKRSIVEYPNPTNLLSSNYAGQNLGEIRGLVWDGWFQSDEEAASYEINQSFVAGKFTAGDTKYVDQLTVDTDGDGIPDAGDGVINNGTNTLGDSGDFVVIGNTTPRYQYGLTLGASWKGIDFNIFIQGVGKKDLYMGSSYFRGPAQGPYHANVMVEHLDYWRPEDTTNPMGPNTDAYFPKPYSANPGNNNRNYRYNVDRYVADASYIRLKSMQIGYTIPKNISQKVLLDQVRIYVSGENLWTKTNLMMYDPEAVKGNFGSAISYPLSRVISTGLNISF
jgi:TonB-linked SusC/RagA family outer membrane protein